MHLKYYKELDGVRGFAALMVIFFHIAQDTDNSSLLLKFLHKPGSFGQTGVTLFFVLSGFLITRILLEAKLTGNYFSNFYIRRSLRIFPLYYLGLIVYLVAQPYFVNGHTTKFQHNWYYWVYLQNIAQTFNWDIKGPSHFWSLAVEEHFYLVWPIIVYYTANKNLLKVLVIIFVVSMLTKIGLSHYGYGSFYFTFTNMDCLGFGAFAALNHIYKWINVKHLLYLAPTALVLLVVNWWVLGGQGNNNIYVFKLPLISLLYMMMIILLTEKDTILNGFFRLKFLRFTGKISYGLYVYHPLCIGFAMSHFKTNDFVFTFILIITSTYLLSYLSYYSFEIWFIKLKDRFTKVQLVHNPNLPENNTSIQSH
ncbi:acyltransferase family protein [Pedobacter duraquae]|uniref:Peptidoglycan/LPS O-acetylase OafA/YrhL n=1 Tax=Pedobacter duraquae TaxID=425511 RepID=A0A4R6IKG7_9SPHI|nr:acyltransferase [Pedobacter duraquae]TDO22521.1 peptidoglycan/LPS O-acetylase OafA/YrhL [Pedobacter duraquae]